MVGEDGCHGARENIMDVLAGPWIAVIVRGVKAEEQKLDPLEKRAKPWTL